MQLWWIYLYDKLATKYGTVHNVNAVNKDRSNRSESTRRHGCNPEFLLVKWVRLVGEVWGTTKVDLNATKAHPILRWTAPQRIGSPSTIRILLGGNRSLYNNNPGHNPQLDWGLPNGYKWPQKVSTTTMASRVQRPKSNNFTSFQLPRILVESTNRCNEAMTRAQGSNPSLSNPTTSN